MVYPSDNTYCTVWPSTIASDSTHCTIGSSPTISIVLDSVTWIGAIFNIVFFFCAFGLVLREAGKVPRKI